MPTARTQAYTSGHSGALWNAHEHKRAELLGLTIDNRHSVPEKIQIYDCFTTDASVTASTGSTQASENLGTTHVLSGKIRFEATIPSAETLKLGKEDLEGTEFLGKASVIASVETANCIIIAQYAMR